MSHSIITDAMRGVQGWNSAEGFGGNRVTIIADTAAEVAYVDVHTYFKRGSNGLTLQAHQNSGLTGVDVYGTTEGAGIALRPATRAAVDWGTKLATVAPGATFNTGAYVYSALKLVFNGGSGSIDILSQN